jgi:hypothetical protein
VHDGPVAPDRDPQSPGGRQLAYVYYRPGWDHNELRVVDANGMNSSTVWQPAAADGGGVETPDWGP